MAVDSPHYLDSLLQDVEDAVEQSDTPQYKYLPHPPEKDKSNSKNNPKSRFAVLPASTSPIETTAVRRFTFENTTTPPKYTSSVSATITSSATAAAATTKKNEENDENSIDALLAMLSSPPRSSHSTKGLKDTPNKSDWTFKAVTPVASTLFPEKGTYLQSSYSSSSESGLAISPISSPKPNITKLPTAVTSPTTTKTKTMTARHTTGSIDVLPASLQSHAHATQTHRSTIIHPAVPSSTSGKARCTKVILGGSVDNYPPRGHRSSAFSKNLCDRMRCINCNFEVLIFPESSWDASVDYMFFRNNMPNAAKLETKLNSQPDSYAYCCQCNWITAKDEITLSPANSSLPQWICSGH